MTVTETVNVLLDFCDARVAWLEETGADIDKRVQCRAVRNQLIKLWMKMLNEEA